MEYLWVLEPDTEYEAPRNKHDKGYKYLLSTKRIFIQLLRCFLDKSWVDRIDENSVEYINKSFILPDFKDKEADVIYKVRIDGKEVFFYILLELQSTVDYQMPYRLLQYMLEIWRTILKDTEKARKKAKKDSLGKIKDKDNDNNNEEMELIGKGKNFKLPVIIPAVLYNGRYRWKAGRTFRAILAANELFDDYMIDFKYILFDVARYTEEELLKLGNLIGAVFYIDQKPKFDEIIKRLRKLIDLLGKLSEEDLNLFRHWLKNVVTRSMAEENAREITKIIDETVEVDNMVYAVEIALRKKIKEVKLEGRLEGKLEGKLEVAKNMLAEGMDMEQISRITKIPVDELQRLLQDLS
ncbi:MAG: Rpn family recombination-promoting nuclease/putative transposase [Clostridiaceae bacterium]|nr:Rpn family recombination-promoting nuclease/putative transposase [Clostridiaceae bacterium]